MIHSVMIDYTEHCILLSCAVAYDLQYVQPTHVFM